MSLYNDASLAMIPSAVKDGKLYSIRPTDGSGDFTFSRGSNLSATRVDVNGLIEKGRENLLLQSNQFDTTWATNSASLTSGQSGYDGTNDAWLLESTLGSFSLYQNYSQSGVSTFSIYAKQGTSTSFAIDIFTSVSTNAQFFNLSDGTLSITTGSVISANIIDVGNGWYRCSVTTNNTGTVYYARITNGVGNTYIQDAQLEVGLVATDYIETTTTTAVSGITEDLPRLDYSGGASCPSLLLEPQRSNLITQSEFFDASQWSYSFSTISSNDSTSPEGFENATRWTSTASGTFLTTSLSISDPCNLSVFVKYVDHPYIQLYSGASAGDYANFDIQNNTIGTSGYNTSNEKIESYGNGWYRISCTFANVSAGSSALIGFAQSLSSNWGGLNTSAAGDVLIYGAQLESNASYPSSYIPTYGSAVTRSQDTYQKSGFGNISTAGTLFYEFSNYQSPLSANGQYMVALFVGSSIGDAFFSQPNSISIINNGLLVEGRNNGYATTLFSFEPTAESVKVALRYDGTNVVAFVNGVKQTEFADTAVGVKNAIRVNNGENSSHATKQLLFFPTALTDSECIALTTL